MSFGAFPGEGDVARGKRRIVVGYFAFGIPARLIASGAEFSEGVPGWRWLTSRLRSAALSL